MRQTKKEMRKREREKRARRRKRRKKEGNEKKKKRIGWQQFFARVGNTAICTTVRPLRCSVYASESKLLISADSRVKASKNVGGIPDGCQGNPRVHSPTFLSPGQRNQDIHSPVAGIRVPRKADRWRPSCTGRPHPLSTETGCPLGGGKFLNCSFVCPLQLLQWGKVLIKQIVVLICDVTKFRAPLYTPVYQSAKQTSYQSVGFEECHASLQFGHI